MKSAAILLSLASLILFFPRPARSAEAQPSACRNAITQAEELVGQGILNYSRAIDMLINTGKQAFSDRERGCYEDVRIALARLYLQGSEHRKALKLLLGQIRTSQEARANAEVNNLIGLAYFNEELYTESAFFFKRAISLDPTMKIAVFNLRSLNRRLLHLNAARAYQKAKDYDRAIKEYRDLLWISQNFVGGRFRLGLLYKDMGLTDEAMKEMKRAYQINPKHRQAHMVLKSMGDLYAAKGDMIEAVNHYSAAVRLNPEYTEALKALERYQFND